MEAKKLDTVNSDRSRKGIYVYVEIISREDRNIDKNAKRQITSFQKNNKGQWRVEVAMSSSIRCCSARNGDKTWLQEITGNRMHTPEDQ